MEEKKYLRCIGKKEWPHVLHDLQDGMLRNTLVII